MKDSCTRDAQNLFSAITVKKVGWVALNVTCARQITLKNVFVPFCSIYSTSAHRVLLIDSVWARGRVLTTSSQNLE